MIMRQMNAKTSHLLDPGKNLSRVIFVNCVNTSLKMGDMSMCKQIIKQLMIQHF